MLFVALVMTAWWVVVPALLAPLASAYAARSSELRADQFAARLGFAPMMAQLLGRLAQEEEPSSATQRFVSDLLSDVPSLEVRLRELNPYLVLRGSDPVSGDSETLASPERLRVLREAPDFPLALAETVEGLTALFLQLGSPPDAVPAENRQGEPVPSGGRN
jgi:hypothetical protein